MKCSICTQFQQYFLRMMHNLSSLIRCQQCLDAIGCQKKNLEYHCICIDEIMNSINRRSNENMRNCQKYAGIFPVGWKTTPIISMDWKLRYVCTKVQPYYWWETLIFKNCQKTSFSLDNCTIFNIFFSKYFF